MKKVIILFVIGFVNTAIAQYAPPVGQIGTKAIAHDSSIIESWATQVDLVRGYEDIAVSGNYVSYGVENDIIGIADNVVVSLGDSGYVTITLDQTIANHAGAEFAVFENSFSDDYLEFAFFEVSSDGINFVRFPSYSNISVVQQTGPYDLSDPNKIHNLAGKYRGMYGTPFDLDDVADSVNVDIDAITHVRIVDVVGTIDPVYASYDSQGNMINDPYPSAFASGGFDLDAVAILHASTASVLEHKDDLIVYPNPVINRLTIETGEKLQITLIDLSGKLIFQKEIQGTTTINGEAWQSGYYLLRIENVQTGNKTTHKIVKQ